LRPTRILKAETFRLAALFALLFLVLTGTLIATVLWIVDGTQRAALAAANDADVETVMNGFRDEGLEEAVEVVKQRLGPAGATGRHKHAMAPEAYLVIENGHDILAGNLSAVTCQQGLFTLALPPSGRHRSRQILGRCAAITDGVELFVGRDTGPLSATRERILHAFTWVAVGTCAIAVVCGLFLGRRFMARVDAVTQTCERVIGGRLEERIPLRGRDDEWDRLARAINEMLDRISALLENLKQVSSDVAHDLRTPLTHLRNRLEAARTSPADVQHYAAVISHAIDDTDQLLSMFSALLRISQVEAGTRAQTFATLCLMDLLEKVYQLYLPVAEDSRHVLSREFKGPAWVRGDEELLIQMFSNLIENAIYHAPEGSQIRIGLEVSDDGAKAAVIDDGPGIPEEERGKVLRRFYRMSSSRSKQGHHGLGLALVAAIAQLHGAQLKLSDAGPGLRVDIEFKRVTSTQGS